MNVNRDLLMQVPVAPEGHAPCGRGSARHLLIEPPLPIVSEGNSGGNLNGGNLNLENKDICTLNQTLPNRSIRHWTVLLLGIKYRIAGETFFVIEHY